MLYMHANIAMLNRVSTHNPIITIILHSTMLQKLYKKMLLPPS